MNDLTIIFILGCMVGFGIGSLTLVLIMVFALRTRLCKVCKLEKFDVTQPGEEQGGKNNGKID